MIQVTDVTQTNFLSLKHSKHWVKSKFSLPAKIGTASQKLSGLQLFSAFIFSHGNSIGTIKCSITWGASGFDADIVTSQNSQVNVLYRPHLGCNLTAQEIFDVVEYLLSESKKSLNRYVKNKKGGAPKGYKGLMLTSEVLPGRGTPNTTSNNLQHFSTQGNISRSFSQFVLNHFTHGLRAKRFR